MRRPWEVPVWMGFYAWAFNMYNNEFRWNGLSVGDDFWLNVWRKHSWNDQITRDFSADSRQRYMDAIAREVEQGKH